MVAISAVMQHECAQNLCIFGGKKPKIHGDPCSSLRMPSCQVNSLASALKEINILVIFCIILLFVLNSLSLYCNSALY